MKVPVRVAAAAVIAVIAGWIAFRHVPPPLPELSPTEFLLEVRQGHVREVVVDGKILTGASSTRGRFRATFDPNDTQLASELRDHDVQVKFEKDSPGPVF
jgi:hypothetical protein